MRKIAVNIFLAGLFLVFAASFSYCGDVNINELISQYSAATEVQRSGIEDVYKYKTISVSGTIKDVMDQDAFDERTDTKGHYYKIVLEPEMTDARTPYNVEIYYKDKSKIASFDKGQKVTLDGTFVNILDNIGSFTIWVFADEVTAEDKAMLGL